MPDRVFLNKFLTKWRAFTVRIFCCFVFSSPGQIPASVGSDDYFSLPTPDELFNIYKTWYRSFLDREYLSWFFFNETQRWEELGVKTIVFKNQLLKYTNRIPSTINTRIKVVDSSLFKTLLLWVWMGPNVDSKLII